MFSGELFTQINRNKTLTAMHSAIIDNFPQPTTLKELIKLTGLGTNYFHDVLIIA